MEMKKWRCLVCGYIHEGLEPPEKCPICSVSKENFELIEAKVQSEKMATSSVLTVVIIGAGIAGISAAEAIVEKSPQTTVHIISAEEEYPYYRINLTRYLANELIEDDLWLKPSSWYEKNGIQLHLRSQVTKIDREKRQIILSREEPLSYDRLIIAAGSSPFIPPFTGVEKENIYTLRTKSDCEAIECEIAPNKRVVVIGGGILGLEIAGALAKFDMRVTLLEGAHWLLSRQLNNRAGLLLEQYAQEQGISFIKGVHVTHFLGDLLATGVVLDSNREIDADFFVIATGVRPSTLLAKKANLTVDGGIIVNDLLQTSDSSIFAVGDVAQHRGVLYGTWTPAQYQGAIAGLNVLGKENQFSGIPRSNILKVLGYDMFSIGIICAEDGSSSFLEETIDTQYRLFHLRDGICIGAILLGNTSLSPKVQKAIEQKVDLSECESVEEVIEKIS